MARTAMGINTTLISIDQQAPMGFIHTTPAGTDGTGEKQWIYTSITAATTAGGLPLGTAVVRATGAPYNDVTVGSITVAPSLIVGVSQAIWDYAAFTPAATQLYGFVLRSGTGSALDGPGAAGLGSPLLPVAAGALDDVAAITDASCGICVSLASGGLIGVKLDCRG